MIVNYALLLICVVRLVIMIIITLFIHDQDSRVKQLLLYLAKFVLSVICSIVHCDAIE